MSKYKKLAQIIAAHDAEWTAQGGREPHSDHYATLDAIIAELREPSEGMLEAAEKREPKVVSEWQPIETAPRDGTPFLAKDGQCVFRAFYKKNVGHNVVRPETLQVFMRPPNSYRAGSHWFNPTHWMPLPEPPK